jgi:hypothetical protein
MTTKPRTIIWAAVSTLEQADDDKFSLDAQIADSMAVAEKNGWQVVDTIRIEGHSRNYRTLAELAFAARANNEPGFDKLIRHFEAKDFDLLLCRDANRFARKTSLLYELVDIILEDCIARIYSLSDNMIVDSSNADIWLMVKGYEIRKQMQWLKTEMQRGKHKLVDDKGIPPGSRHVWSHMKVRNEFGKVLAFIPDPSKTAVIQQAAQLVIDRVSWPKVESRLFEQGFGQNGQPFKRYFFYHLFNNPWFWGDAVRNHKNAKLDNGQKIGLWCVDASQPVPEGIVIRRDVNPPALTGDRAVHLRAELIRRMTFRPRDHDEVHWFSGLLVCRRCGFMLVHSSSHSGAYYYCQSKYTARSRPGCDKKYSISELKAKKWMNRALELMLESQNPYSLLAAEPQPQSDVLNRLQDELSGLDKQVRRLIEKQTAAPDSLADFYDDQIEGVGRQRENLLRRIEEETRQSKRYNLADIESAYRELTTYETLDAFWASDRGVINQLLHRLLGGRRLTMLDNQITGSVDYV